MSIGEPEHLVWVIAAADHVCAYDPTVWERIERHLDALLLLTNEPAIIRTMQTREGTKNWLPFGRLSWSRSSNQRWTTKYLRDPGERGVRFWCTEIWSPSPSVCDREVRRPTLFAKLDNAYVADSRERQTLTIAAIKTLADAYLADIRRIVTAIGEELETSRVVEVQRAWWDIGGLADVTGFALLRRYAPDS